MFKFTRPIDQVVWYKEQYPKQKPLLKYYSSHPALYIYKSAQLVKSKPKVFTKNEGVAWIFYKTENFLNCK